MLDIQFIRENPDLVKQAVMNKNEKSDVDLILKLDSKRRELIKNVEILKRERNAASKKISDLKKDKKDAAVTIGKMKSVSEKIKEYDKQIISLEQEIYDEMSKVPNIPHTSVNHGKDENDNPMIFDWGDLPKFDFEPADHLQLSDKLDLFDFPRGAKISGSGFPVYKGYGALLDRALINYMLDTHIKNGYKEITVPYLVNPQSAFGTGQLPKLLDDMYFVEQDKLYAIPTAEVPVTNIHRDEILSADQLPIKYCSYSSCFRREAGSYGKDTRGFMRVHQFHKVELVKFVEPDKSYDELELLRESAENIIKSLGLRYRVLSLCDADLSFAAAKCYDLEVWAPGEKKYLEVSSCSNFEDFQARRINIRYRPQSGGKVRFIHTLNGSALATARILIALIETFQNADGTVSIPEVLQPYMNGIKEIGPNDKTD
ncbi:MAG: serine--tRNA ligase [Chitinispirillia bacterium]|jgi:seryl-tRNA synthetase